MTYSLIEHFELERAKARIKNLVGKRINNAIRFRNCLHGFVEDLNRNRGAHPYADVLCVDTSEVFAWASPNRSTASALAFGDLQDSSFSGGDAKTQDELAATQAYRDRLNGLDRLVLNHLLFGRDEWFGLLDPHAEEIGIIFNAVEKQQEELVQDASTELSEDIWSLSEKQLGNIQNWILDQTGRDTIEEFKTFRNTFLPAWRDALIRRLGQLRQTKQRLDKFLRDGQYCFFSPEKRGRKSAFDRIEAVWGIKIDRDGFEKYLAKEEIRETFNETRKIIVDLASVIAAPARSEELRSEAIRRDAEALALIHVINTYFRRNEIPARVELVTRSPTLHNVVTMLPRDRIWVSLRHPLFIPEIYSFPPDALEQIAQLFQAVDHALRPWLDALDSRNWPDGIAEENQSKVILQVNQLSRRLVEVLADYVTVQHTLDEGEEAVEQTLYQAATSQEENKSASAKNAVKVGTSNELVQQILATFQALIDVVREKRDPYSKEILQSLQMRVKELVRFEIERIPDERLLNATYNELTRDAESGCAKTLAVPVDCVQFRFVNSQLPRVFQLYSKSIPRVLLPKQRTEAKSAANRLYHILNVRDLLMPFLEEPSKDKVESQDSIEELDRALVCGSTLAALGRFAAAGTIASSVLRQVTNAIRNKPSLPEFQDHGEPDVRFSAEALFKQGTDPKLALCFKELFLLRYYCECVIALQELDAILSNPEQGESLARPEGGAVKNFGRAQRDLNFAIYLNEQAAVLAGYEVVRGWHTIPTGSTAFEDLRFPLIRFDGWLEQLIMLNRFGYMNAPDPLAPAVNRQLWAQRRRAILWSADGFIKELETIAYRASSLAAGYRQIDKKADSSANNRKDRYFTYVEARALQHLNITLSTFLAFEISREIQALWNPRVAVSQDQLLFFRNWRFWKDRFRYLNKDFDFQFRSEKFVEPILTAIGEIDGLRQRISRRGKTHRGNRRESRKLPAEWKAEYKIILDKLSRELHESAKYDNIIEDRLFLRYVRTAVLAKVATLMNG